MTQQPTEPVVRTRSGLVSLHPTVYQVFVVLAAVFVLAAWTFFGNGKYAGIVLAVVTLFFGFAIGLLTDVAHIWRDHHDLHEDPGMPTASFHEWLRSDVRIARDTVTGRNAAFMAALPIAAGAVGIVLLAIVHWATVG